MAYKDTGIHGWRLSPSGVAGFHHTSPSGLNEHVIVHVPATLLAIDHPGSDFQNPLATRYLARLCAELAVPPPSVTFGQVYLYFWPGADTMDILFAERLISEYFEISPMSDPDEDWQRLYLSNIQEGLVMSDEPTRKRNRPPAIQWPSIEVVKDPDTQAEMFKCAQTGRLMESRYYVTVSKSKKGAFYTIPEMATWIRTNVQPEARVDKLLSMIKDEWEQVGDISRTGENEEFWREVPGAEPVGVYLKSKRTAKKRTKTKKAKVEKDNKVVLSKGAYLFKPTGGAAIEKLESADDVVRVIAGMIKYTKRFEGVSLHSRLNEVGVIINPMCQEDYQADKLRDNHTLQNMAGVDVGLRPVGPGLFIPIKKVNFVAPKGVHLKAVVEQEDTEPTEPIEAE